jgi:uncharacterized protein (TIGR03067 family)
MSADAFEGASVTIKGTRFASVGMGGPYDGTIELDETKKPKAFDLVITGGHAAGTRNLGIYALNGKTWTICLATRGARRPKTFATRAGTGLALETLERGRAARSGPPEGGPHIKTAPEGGPHISKAPEGGPRTRKARVKAAGADRVERVAAHAAPSGAVTVLEGEWAMEAGVINGAVMGPDLVTWCRRITRGDITAVVAGPQTMLKARFTLDQSKTPHAIDYVNLEGANKGKSQAGICEWKGGTLSICMAAPGKPRPGEFASKPKDGRSYTTWRRTRT